MQSKFGSKAFFQFASNTNLLNQLGDASSKRINLIMPKRNYTSKHEHEKPPQYCHKHRPNHPTTDKSLYLKIGAGTGLGVAVATGTYFLGKSHGKPKDYTIYNTDCVKTDSASTDSANTDSANTDTNKTECDTTLSKECSICLKSFKQIIDSGDEIHSTKCGHIFCKTCITQALATRNHCPICNVATKNKTIRIFL